MKAKRQTKGAKRFHEVYDRLKVFGQAELDLMYVYFGDCSKLVKTQVIEEANKNGFNWFLKTEKLYNSYTKRHFNSHFIKKA